MNRFGLTLIFTLAFADPALAQVADNLLIVTFDGLRWQEVLAGADETLINREHGGVRDIDELKRRFWRDDPVARRETLMPFFWSTLAAHGQIFGDAGAGSPATVTNPGLFSYPGYNELLTGRADPAIDSNAKIPNPNLTVLEWLNLQPGFKSRVGVVASWDVFPSILNEERSLIPVNAGWEPLEHATSPARRRELNRFATEIPHYWDNVRYDLFTFEAALGELSSRKTRVLYVAFGETDDWAHDGRYDLYLDSAQRTDDLLRRLWEWLQSHRNYKGRTALLVTSDHGRGGGIEDWRDHGSQVPGAERIWIAAMGPGISPRGIVANQPTTQSQVAATAAALLGLDFRAERSDAAPAIEFQPTPMDSHLPTTADSHLPTTADSVQPGG